MPVTDRGYFALYRGTLDHPVFKKERFTEALAWVWMIEAAAYAPKREFHLGREVQIEPGQFSRSIRELARIWQWEKTRVERYFEKLRRAKMIELETATGVTIVTVCNYLKFQPGQWEGRDSGATLPRQQRDSSATCIKRKQGNKEIKEESPSLRSGGKQPESAAITGDLLSPSGTVVVLAEKTRKKNTAAERKIPWPDGFDLDGDLHRYATDAGIAADAVYDLWERFRAHHIKNGNQWAGERGWRAAWQGWVRNEIKFSKDRRPNSPAKYDPIEHARARIQEMTAEDGELWPKQAN